MITCEKLSRWHQQILRVAGKIDDRALAEYTLMIAESIGEEWIAAKRREQGEHQGDD